MFVRKILTLMLTGSRRTITNTVSQGGQAVFEKTACPQMLNRTSECLACAGQTQVFKSKKILSPDVEYLRQLTDKYSQTEAQIGQTKREVIEYLKNISSSLEEIPLSATNDELETNLAKKAVIDYMIEHVNYNKNFLSLDRPVGFEFGLPTKTISRNLKNFQEEFDKSVFCFKKEGILSVSEYDPKKYQFDADDIMKKYEQKTRDANYKKYQELFNPIERLRGSLFSSDPYLSNEANFYRIISPDELRSLVQTKKTKEFIDANGHFTDGHYSCITTNPNYNEQAFAANGLPIRLKFKTKDRDGFYNMSLLNRIGVIKPERSIYKVHGYNFDDIDWNNICVNSGDGWKRLDKEFTEELISKLSG